MSIKPIILADNWSLSLKHAPEGAEVPKTIRGVKIPAKAPGSVYTDLLVAGLIEDPYVGLNELETHWIGKCDWVYETEFHVEASVLGEARVEAVFDGLDTIADVSINGQKIGLAENMHLRYRFDAKPYLREGANQLTVHFYSCMVHAYQVEQEVGERPIGGIGTNEPLPYNMIRKMACNFGWDWGPRLLTCGIWRPARIEAWSTARVQDVRPLVTKADENDAVVKVHVDCDRAESHDKQAYHVQVVCTLYDPDNREVARRDAALHADTEMMELHVDKPRLWWPIGYGDQPLYRLHVEVKDPAGQAIDCVDKRIGLRTVELNIEPDAQPYDKMGGLIQGEAFEIKVNGQRVYCKGANWIPDDCFPHRVTTDRYRRRLDQAIEANMNMVRVWGGGTYEDDIFYDYCDEKGLLVWQDFCMACACYPEEQPLWSLIEAEAYDNVARLCSHPSLVIWVGSNECIWGTFAWSAFGDIRTEGKLTWGEKYYLELFPKVLKDLDPSRPYWASSPYSGSMDRHPNDNEYGNRHIWDVWGSEGCSYYNYLSHYPRFLSEFGFQGPPTWPTLSRAIPEQERQWFSETSLHHNKHKSGQERGLNLLRDSFVVPESFDDQVFLASINQARAITLGSEWYRALSPWCSGVLFWQLNDCWPVSSWSAIDGDGRPKLLWYGVQKSFRPRLMTIKPAAVTPSGEDVGQLAVYLHNDHHEPWVDTLTICKMNLQGQTLDTLSRPIEVEPRDNQRICLPEDWTAGPGQFILAELDQAVDDDKAWWFHKHDYEINYPETDLKYVLRDEKDGGQTLIVTSNVVVRDLCLLADRICESAEVDQQMVNLLPGDLAIFRIYCNKHLTLDELTREDVLRCINTVVRSQSDKSSALQHA